MNYSDQYDYEQACKIISGETITLGNLYLGSKYSAEQELEKLKVGAIVTVADEFELQVKGKPHLILKVVDLPEYDLFQHFEISNVFIQQQLMTTNVLVHCFHGISRSPAIVAAYLMKVFKLTSEQALEKIKKVRHFVLPNPGFLKQLKLYEEQKLNL